MRNYLAPLVLAAVAACTPGCSKYEGPTAQQDEEDGRIAQALDAIEAVKIQLIKALGGEAEGIIRDPSLVAVGSAESISAIGCASSHYELDAYHEAVRNARSIVREWRESHRLFAEDGFTDDNRVKTVESGSVVCVKSTAVPSVHGGGTNAE